MALPHIWKIREPGVGWWITTISPSNPDLQLLVAANRAAAFGEAARWMVHDLRSTAQSLTLMADLMADPATEVEAILRESSARLAHSLDVLSRALLTAPAMEVGPISVREPIDFIAELHHAGRTRSRLELVVDPAVQAAAGIERHFEHALLNLVLNSMAALHAQERGLIRLTARNHGDQVEVAVADNGPGIAPDLAGRLFDSTAPADAPHQPAATGLVVAREVLRLSGGTLNYAPHSEPGARFVITLPLWRRTAARPKA